MDTLQKRIKEIQVSIKKLRNAESKITQHLNRTIGVPKLKQFVGKCYRFSNGSGSGHRWWLYGKIRSFDAKKMVLLFEEFQITDEEIPEAKLSKDYVCMYPDGSFSGSIFIDSGEEIAASIFEEAKAETLKLLKGDK